MKFNLVLFVLFVTSQVVFSQEKQENKRENASPAVVEKGLIKVSVMYPFAEGKTFDMEYYETKHMPMVAGFLGLNLVKYTIEKGVAGGIPNMQLPFIAIGSFYVKDLNAYKTAIEPNRDAIRSDFPNYTNITPVILISEVVR